MKQLTLIREKKYAGRKTARAISLRGANHIVLKSLRPVLRRHHCAIRMLLRESQDRFGVKIQALAIMSDHVHLIIRVRTRIQFANALRFLAGAIALRVSGIQRRAGLWFLRLRLWRARAWSRPVQTRKDLLAATAYVARNPVKADIWSRDDSFLIIDGVLQI